MVTCEDKLVEQAARGDTEAFRHLWDAHHAVAMAAAFRLCHHHALAEEITQGIVQIVEFLKMLLRRHGQVDLIIAYTSDGRIPVYQLEILKDPKQAFPPYDAILLLSPDADPSWPEKIRQAVPGAVAKIYADPKGRTCQHRDRR